MVTKFGSTILKLAILPTSEKRIEEAIVHSKKFVCILGPSWVNSPNCRYEFQKAVELEKRIIPVNYQDFRTLLRAKKDDGIITKHDWIRIDKPQEVDFQTKEKFEKSYKTLKSILGLKDKITEKHSRILCDAYYWEMYDKPKSMLLDGNELSKVKSLRSKCNNDEESPSFSPLQDAFIEASEIFVKKEISNKRKVFLSFDMHEAKFASELDMELRLHNISTWHDIDLAGEKKDDSFIEPILNCEHVIDIVSDLGEVERRPSCVFCEIQQ